MGKGEQKQSFQPAERPDQRPTSGPRQSCRPAAICPVVTNSFQEGSRALSHGAGES